MGFVCAIRPKRIVAKQLKHIQKTLIALNNIHPFSWENLEKENKARGRWDLNPRSPDRQSGVLIRAKRRPRKIQF